MAPVAAFTTCKYFRACLNMPAAKICRRQGYAGGKDMPAARICRRQGLPAIEDDAVFKGYAMTTRMKFRIKLFMFYFFMLIAAGICIFKAVEPEQVIQPGAIQNSYELPAAGGPYL
jgi:hypothetical protein